MTNELDQNQVKDIAEQVSKEVVKQLMLTLGLNTNDPDEILKVQRDFAHLRSWRESVETIKHKSLAAAVWFIVTSSLGLLVVYISRH